MPGRIFDTRRISRGRDSDFLYIKIAARPRAGFYLHRVFGRPGSGILYPCAWANVMCRVTSEKVEGVISESVYVVYVVSEALW